MKTKVSITIVIEHEYDSQYEMAMNQIEMNIKEVPDVVSVNTGIGEEDE
jgi:hypothetical protein